MGSIVSNYDLGVLETYDLDIDSGTHYYTDYPTIVTYDIESSKEEQDSGTEITAKVIRKKIINVKLWLDEDDMNSLVQGMAVSDDIEIDSVVVLENSNVEVTELAYDLYECNVKCVTVITRDYPLA